MSIAGGMGLAGNAFIGGTTNITSSQTSISTTSGALVVTGGVGIGGTLFTSAGSTSSVSGVLLQNGNVSASTYNKLTLTAPPNSATLTLANSSSLITSGGNSLTLTTTAASNVTFPTAGTLLTSGATSPAFLTSITTSDATFSVFNTNATIINAFGVATAMSFGAATGKATFNSTDNSTSTITGGLVVSGGAGVAKSVSIGGRLQMFNSSLYTAFSSAQSGISTVYTLPPTSPATGTSVLQSTSAGVMSWGPPPGTNLQTPATGSFGYVQYVGIANSFASSSGFVYEEGNGELNLGYYTSTPSAGTALLQLKQINSFWNGSDYGTYLAINAGTAFTGDLVHAQLDGVSRLQLNAAGYLRLGVAGTGFTLPITNGTSGQVLTANTNGIASWTTVSGGGTPGGSNKQIQFNNSSAFGGASGFEYTTGGIAVTVAIFSPSGTGYTSGLWISAIGGTVTRVGIGLSNPQFELEILGELSATNKSFVINHPTKSGMKLRYGSLEGPENGVYVRGELNNSNIIEVPDHWIGLVHEDSYTVHLTPIGKYAQLYVEKIENYNVYIADNHMNPIHCYYSVWAERKDIPKLVTEY